MIRSTFVTLFCLGFAGFLATSVSQAIRTGKIRAGGEVLVRHDRPTIYWLAVAAQVVFAGMSLFVFYREVLRG